MNNRVLEYYIRAKDFTRGVLGSVAGRIKNFAFSVGRNLMNIKAGFEMLKKAAQELAKPLMVAFRREAITMQFAVLFRSLKKAKDHMKDLADFASRTPFQMEGIAKASRQLYVFSSGVLGGKDTLKLIGDAASATGNNMDELASWVGRAYSMIAGGKPFGEAAMRLQELGILTPSVRQKMEELQASGASSADVWFALRDSLAKYSGGMDVASRTGEGLLSTLKDVGDEAKNKFGQSFMEAAKGGIQYFIDLIRGFTEDGTIEKWAERTKNLLLSVFGAIKGLKDKETRADTWNEIKEVLSSGFEIGATKAIRILAEYLPKFGVTLGRMIKDGAKNIFVNKYHEEHVKAAKESGIIDDSTLMGKIKAKLHQSWWSVPEDKKQQQQDRVNELIAERYKTKIDDRPAEQRFAEAKNKLKARGTSFEDAGKAMEFSESDVQEHTGAQDAARLAQRALEKKKLDAAQEELRAGAVLKRIEEEKQARLKLEQELSEERLRLQSKEISQRITESTEAERKMASQLDRAKAQVAQAWGWYRDKEGFKAQLEEEKDEAAARKQFDKDFDRLQFRKRDWRTAKNLSLDDEAVRRVGVAMEEEAAAKRAVIETAENTRKLNEKFDAVISMKGG